MVCRDSGRKSCQASRGKCSRPERVPVRTARGNECAVFYEGEPFRIVGQVAAYDPPRLLALTWREEGWPVDTLVTFRLTEDYGRTRLTVIHSGFENLPLPFASTRPAASAGSRS